MAVIILKMDLYRVLYDTYTFDSPCILLTVFLCLPETTLHQIRLLINSLVKIIPILGQKCNYRSLEKVGALTFNISSCILLFLIVYWEGEIIFVSLANNNLGNIIIFKGGTV